MQNVGIIIGRFSPLHLGHISLINYSLENNDKTIVIIGSAEKIDEKNPYTLDERLEILKSEFDTSLTIDYLNDSKEDLIWINNLNNIISKYSLISDNINFLGGDLKNDYAINVIKEHIEKFNYQKISFFEKNRLKIPISATIIRNLLKENNNEEAKKWLSEKTTSLIIKKSH
ncbi:adenylyltransferase/cytidyltransferase family protein [Candidatus Gracilibacteria bacterium]|nr:adenylyltransferase/cytidyltransferase family protein [Candidatus Gracilibacteria bacterium]